MIESNIIKWLDLGDTTQKMDVYSKERNLKIFKFFRVLNKNRFPITVDIILIVLYFFQLLSLTSYFASYDDDFIPNAFYYFKNFLLLSDIAYDYTSFVSIFDAVLLIITFDIIFMILIYVTLEKIKLMPIIYIVNITNTIIYYYFVGPALGISGISFWCGPEGHVFLKLICYTSVKHLSYVFLTFIIIILYGFIAVIYSLFYIELGFITTNLNKKLTGIRSKYELFSCIYKIFIFLIFSMVKSFSYMKIVILIYLVAIIIINFFLCIYVYKKVYYYNDKINFLLYCGWLFTTWYSICIFLKCCFQIKNISNSIIIGWIIIAIALYKYKKIRDFLLISESNFLSLKSVKVIGVYISFLLKELYEKNNNVSKILFYGNVKKNRRFH